jgi:hypothetical protein
VKEDAMNPNDRETDPHPLPLAEWLRSAYAEDSGCPPPEAYLDAEALTAEERRRLDEHAGRCPACAAERDLARLFAAGPEAPEVSREDLDFVVARLAAASPVRPAGQVVPFPSTAAATAARTARRAAGPSRFHQVWKIAAALILVLGGGLLFRLAQPAAPVLPAPEVGGAVRGGEIDALSPLGDVGAVPSELRWTPRQGATLYRVRLSAVDDTVIWEGMVPAPPATLPGNVVSQLHRAVSYVWTVEALDASGARMAATEPVRFRVQP